MDLVKKTNVVKATSFDYNAKKVVIIRNRGKLTRLLNRYARRKLRQELKKNINNSEG